MDTNKSRRRWWEKIMSDPVKHAQYLDKHRKSRTEAARRRMQQIKSDPQRHAALKEKMREYCKKSRERRNEEQKKAISDNMREWYSKNIERHNASRKKYYAKIRSDTISHYGGKCACCGESEIKFLQLDHINGDGAEKRKQAGCTGRQYYAKLRRAGWPDGYRVLCANCHQAISFYDGCPHGLKANRAWLNKNTTNRSLS